MRTQAEIAELEKICEAPVMQLLKRNKDFGEVNLVEIMSCNSRARYSLDDLTEAAALID